VAVVRLLGDARRSIAAALGHSINEFGPEAAARYAALIEQAINDFARSPSAVTVRRVGEPRKGRSLLRYDLVSSQDKVPPGIGQVGKPRHFIVGRLDGDLLRILFMAHDSMKPENILRRSRRSDLKDD
jgi:plasmid stabilization system protein ParE